MRWLFIGSFASSLLVFGYVFYWFRFVWDVFDASSGDPFDYLFIAVLVLVTGPLIGFGYARRRDQIGRWWAAIGTVIGGWAAGWLLAGAAMSLLGTVA
jgi:hypothetical protein